MNSMIFSPDEIRSHQFALARRGYDRTEVDGFLDRVAQGLTQLLQTEQDLRVQLTETDRAPAGAVVDTIVAAEATTVTIGVDDLSAVGDEVAAVLRTARESASRILEDARTEATRVRGEAEAEAARRRLEAETHAQRIREETESELARLRADAEAAREEAGRALAVAQERASSLTAEADATVAQAAIQARVEAERSYAEVVAATEQRLDILRRVEQEILYNLTATHSDLGATIARLDREPDADAENDVADRSGDNDDVSQPVAALFGLDKSHESAEDDPDTSSGDIDEANGPADSDPVADLAKADDPLAELVKQAVGKAVERAAEQARGNDE